ncbi:MAG: DUF1800 family protein [Chitinophagales bacterium]|nr:DUF1800 family protein [Chitinophagales bacterium]
MKQVLLSSFFITATLFIHAQIYDDYVGAGHTQGVTVTSSSSSFSTDDNSTINGNGLDVGVNGAARFLNYASLGVDYETIKLVSDTGISTWVDIQVNRPPQVSFTDTTWAIWENFSAQYINKFGQAAVEDPTNLVIPAWFYWKMAWWNNILKADDHIRQRTAQALSQIFVVSEKSELQASGPGLANFYDVLYNNALGNYRDLLFDVTMHPAMGFYLTHINNPKSDPANNIHPDENYAREVMQLFTIGLYELNIDGSHQLDSAGNAIPTYNNNDIKEFAKIFTGLGPQNYYWPWQDYSGYPVTWGIAFNDVPSTVTMWKPMKAFEAWHEPGAKYLLNGTVVPAGQSTMQDINAAVDNLFNHPNVGPFIGKQLIQRLVKSNPTPAYIARVAAVFNDNGQGERGDMKAVIKAIITDEEAIDCSWINDAYGGKLREPLLKYTQALRAFNVYNQSGKMWNWGYLFDEAVSQGVLTSPSVFNFYLPSFSPNGPISDADLVAPEFQIHTSATSINYINLAYVWFVNSFYGEISTHADDNIIGRPSYDINTLDPADYFYLDLADELAIASNAEELVDRIDLILTGGLFSDDTKASIVQAVNSVNNPDEKVKAALFLAFISPDYNILK